MLAPNHDYPEIRVYEEIHLHSGWCRPARGLRTKNRNGRARVESGEFTGSHYGGGHKHAANGHRCWPAGNSHTDALNNYGARPSKPYMKKYICLLMGAALLAACEQKETTVTNPPVEKKDTTIIKESPAPATKTETKTDININPSPSP